MQSLWSNGPNKVLDPETAAAIVAENVDRLEWGEGEAAQGGINQQRFDELVQEVLNAPGFGELVRMLRRGTVTTDDFLHGLRKARLETRWDDPLTELQDDRLDPAVVATSIQRGTMRDPGYLPVGPPTEEGLVPPMPVSPLDPEREAAASGINPERLAALTRIVGLPPSPGELLQLVNRGEIGEVDFYRGIAEGNTRNEWGSFLLKLQRRLLTPHEYAELALRGWITESERDAGAALSGLEPADTQLLFDMLGRPIVVHQIVTGLARGGEFGGDYAGVPEPYQTALRQSNVRPEWGNLAYANRYTYPSAFVIRTLATTGELAPDEVTQTLLDIGWKPDLVEKVVTAWTGSGDVKSDPHVAKAETHLWNALHKAYVDDQADDAKAGAALTAIGAAQESHAAILSLWDAERAIVRSTLTPAQIKKAIGQPGKDQAWALARLGDLGYTAADAETFLSE